VHRRRVIRSIHTIAVLVAARAVADNPADMPSTTANNIPQRFTLAAPS
jgi:hypothetical protein